MKNKFFAEKFRRPTPTSWEPSLSVEDGTTFITLSLGITKHLKCRLIGATFHLHLLTSLHGLVSEIFLKVFKNFSKLNSQQAGRLILKQSVRNWSSEKLRNVAMDPKSTMTSKTVPTKDQKLIQVSGDGVRSACRLLFENN